MRFYSVDGAPVTSVDFYKALLVAEQEAAEREILKQRRILKSDEVAGYLNSNFFAQWVDSESYLYDELSFFGEAPPTDGFPDFFQQYADGNPNGLRGPDYYVGPSLLIPIVVGDIVIFVNSAEYGKTHLSTKRVGTSPIDLFLLREQIRKLTRRSWLQDHPDLEQLAISLYANGAAYGVANGIRLGQALTEDQQWEVPRDMIWPEFRFIDNQSVLVPVLYLTQSTYVANETRGARIIANNISLQYDNFTVDGGAIIARRNLMLTAAEEIHNSEGAIEAGGTLWAHAGGRLENLSGKISGEQISLIADELVSETLVIRHDYAQGYNDTAQNLARITSLGDLVIQANGDVTFSGSEVNANGDITVESTAGNISLLTVPVSEYFSDSERDGSVTWSITESATTHIQSQLSGENIALLAGQAIVVNGGIVSSQGQLQLLAGMGIYILDETNQSSSDFLFESSTGGLFGTDESVEEQSHKIETVRSLITAGNDIALKTINGDITLKAVDLATESSLLVDSPNGAIYLQLAKDLDFHSYAESSEDRLVFSNSGFGHQTETAIYNQMNAQGGVVFNAGTGIFVEYTGDSISLDENLDLLAARPGMEWINAVRNNHAAEWSQIQLANEEWDYSSQGLTKVGAALLQIAVTAVAGGFDFSGLLSETALADTALDAALTHALEVGAGTLMTQAGHALVANGFDPVATLEDLASQDSIEDLLSSMATAGAIQGFNQLTEDLFTLDSDTIASLGLPTEIGGLDYVSQTFDTLKSATVSTALSGGSFDEAFEQQLAANIINWAGAKVAKKIGDGAVLSYREQNSAMFTESMRLLQHAALGCALGEIKGNDCSSGAFGAVSAEVIAQFAGGIIDLENTLDADERARQIHAYSLLGSVLLADLADRDIVVVQQTGGNAVANNYLKHAEQEAFADELNQCNDHYLLGTPEQQNCFNATFDTFQALSDQNNADLKIAYDACVGSGSSARSSECQSYIGLASEGLAILTPVFHDLDFTRNANSINKNAGAYTQEQIEASLERALSENGDIFDALIARHLDDEITPLPGSDFPMYESYETLQSSGVTFESAITVEHRRMVATGIAIIALEEATAGVGVLALRVGGTLLVSKTGKVLGQLRKTDAGDDVWRTADGDFGTNNPALDAWLETTTYYLKTDLRIHRQIDFDHINGGTDLRGGHILQSARVRIETPGTETVNDNGTLSAIVQIRNVDGEWRRKGNRGGESTLFPPDWPLAKVEYEITEAVKNARLINASNQKYEGITPSGIKMTLFPPPPNNLNITKWRGWPLPD